MPPTDISRPDYFHKVVDCQWACPAHTPVPEYIRLIAAGRYTDAYMVNWTSNVFPGILGRTCDRPCEPACRRGRVEAEPVAICRLKRVAADNKGDLAGLLPKAPATRNGKRVALIGAGPASLTVARDLAPLGYAITLIDSEARGGGMIRSQIPRFRLPETVIDEEVGYIIGIGGIETRFGTRVESLRTLLTKGSTRSSSAPGRRAAAISRFRAGARLPRTSMSASTGWPTSPSGTWIGSAAGSWCSAAATPPWIAAAPPGVSAARRSRSWSVRASTR